MKLLACLVVAMAALFGLVAGCDEDPPGEECCQCLVKYDCIDADEYEYCVDTLADGDSIQLSAWASLSCNQDACIEANKCAPAM